MSLSYHQNTASDAMSSVYEMYEGRQSWL